MTHKAVQKHGLRPSRMAPVRPHEVRSQLTLFRPSWGYRETASPRHLFHFQSYILPHKGLTYSLQHENLIKIANLRKLDNIKAFMKGAGPAQVQLLDLLRYEIFSNRTVNNVFYFRLIGFDVAVVGHEVEVFADADCQADKEARAHTGKQIYFGA